MKAIDLLNLIEQKPRSSFQKQYRKEIEFQGRKIWQFPGRYGTPKKGKTVEIPSEIRRGQGSAPSKEEEELLYGAWRVAKSELDYLAVQDLVNLTGISKERVHNIITYLVRQQRAFLNVDRWGNAVYVKLRR